MLANTLFVYVIMRFGISVGGFVPKTYVQQVVENSDFRKYDDGLRMILDCTPELEGALTKVLAAAAAAGIVRYGLHRQDAAMMTCFTPSVAAQRPRAFHRRRPRRLCLGGHGAEGDGGLKPGDREATLHVAFVEGYRYDRRDKGSEVPARAEPDMR